ncbi:MAG TPA: hypothetical protein VG916_13510 [Gemmatimonadaceae bacterium]|nr:hypothetical protein [Gemmatimonadaceae bacterium]
MNAVAQRAPAIALLAIVVGIISGATTLGAPAVAARRASHVNYTLRIDAADLSAVAVEMTIHDAPADFRVAMVHHPEYDDEYWRYLDGPLGESAHGTVTVTREDSSAWHVTAPAGDVTLRYRVRYPPTAAQQQVWKAHLTPMGGLVGGPHSFLYMEGAERAPVGVTVQAPAGWQIVTGLDTTTDAHTFAANGIEPLVDSPMLVGRLARWGFDIDNIKYGVSWLGRPTGVPFDTTRLVSNLDRIARAAVRTFDGKVPFDRYEFLFEDGAFGALEHANSVSVGIPSPAIARDPTYPLPQLAHEFFHTWNEVHLRPEAWIGVRHVAPEPTGEIWWAEGVTFYYADLLLRRAVLPVSDTTRTTHLAHLYESWLANPSNRMVSPEDASRAFNRPLGVLGDLSPSFYTQGELLGNILDLTIRAHSKGRRSLDDAMRALTRRFSMERGYTARDVQGAVEDACGCNLRAFFDAHVRGTDSLDLNTLLKPAGLRVAVTWKPVLGADGLPAPDLRIQAGQSLTAPGVLLNVLAPVTPLARAGYHTRERVLSVNGTEIADVATFRRLVGALHIGDTLRVVVARGAGTYERPVVIGGYARPTVEIGTNPQATAAQRKLLEDWKAAR